MDKRKIAKFKQDQDTNEGVLTEGQRTQQILNSKSVNEALLYNAEQMFDIEFALKQKAQLKYLQKKTTMQQHRFKFLNLLSHEFLWTATPVYYLGTAVLYLVVKNRMRLTLMHALPFLAIPPTFDYLKREHYVTQFPDDKKAMLRCKSVVD